MKTKLFALLLASLLVLAFSVPVLAEGEKPGAITINNAVPGATYKVFKILDLKNYSEPVGTKGQEGYVPGKYSYTVATAWANFFKSGAKGLDYMTVDADGYVTAKEDMDAAAFAADAAAFAEEKGIVPEYSDTAAGKTVSVTDLELGYYLVTSSVGIVCALTTTQPTAEINEKNEVPTIEKKAGEDLDYAVAQIGDTIDFTVTVKAVEGNTAYKVVDTMTGLEYVTGSAKLNGVEIESGISYDDGVLTIELGNLAADATITYSATVTADALTAAGNTAELKYKNKDEGDGTDTDTLKVYIWEVSVYKYAGTLEDNDYPLKDAKFGIYTDEDCTTPLYIMPIGDAKDSFRVMTDEEVIAAGGSAVNTVITDVSGKFEIKNLAAGTYYLKELEAPKGYNPLTSPVEFTIETVENDGVVTEKITVNGEAVDEIDIENKAGSPLLPETGGAGTVALVVVGCVLFIITGVILVTKKRVYNEG